jgi:predicted metal-dependent hydrolase
VDPGSRNTEHEIPNTSYEKGVELFNRGEYFDAHEVWEDLWMECPSAERRFIQALIQAAVAIHHFERGNHAGAARLFKSGRAYMEPFRPDYRGLNVDSFWRQMEAHLAPALPDNVGLSGPRPVIVLTHQIAHKIAHRPSTGGRR